MTTISVLNINNRSYSIKYNVDVNYENNSIKVKILGVDLVDPITLTSYKKLKTVFDLQSSGAPLNRERYGLIYENLTKELIEKHKPSSIVFL